MRLFIGLELPGPVLEGIIAWQRRELSDPALRPLRAEQLHITLAFLGYRPEKVVERLAAILGRAAGPAPLVELLGDPVARPSMRRPRLFAIEASSPEAIALQGELSEQLARARLYEPEKRAFWPHITAARVRPERGRRGRFMAVDTPPGALPGELCTPFRAVRLTLYRSTLRPGGAQYDPLAQVELPAAEQ